MILGAGDTVVIRSHGEFKKRVWMTLEARGVRCVNATCPNVLPDSKAGGPGRAGGTAGRYHRRAGTTRRSWALPAGAAQPLVFQTTGGGAKHGLPRRNPDPEIPVTVVAQTTCIRELFETSWKILKKQCTNVKIFDTICNATHKRQTEAAEIAAKVDVMVVVGDRKSANTKHLTEICKKSCSRRASDRGGGRALRRIFSMVARVAGLTAGASTPAGIIKEVYDNDERRNQSGRRQGRVL